MFSLFKRIFSRVDKRYVSETDRFLSKLDREIPLSASQCKEIQKHARIFKLRDRAEKSS